MSTIPIETYHIVDPRPQAPKLTLCGRSELGLSEDAVSILCVRLANCADCLKVIREGTHDLQAERAPTA